jgi:hypothetical protein
MLEDIYLLLMANNLKGTLEWAKSGMVGEI